MILTGCKLINVCFASWYCRKAEPSCWPFCKVFNATSPRMSTFNEKNNELNLKANTSGTLNKYSTLTVDGAELQIQPLPGLQ